MPEVKFPTSFSEFVDLTIVTGSAGINIIGDFARNTYTSLTGDKEVGHNRESPASYCYSSLTS